MREIPFKIIVYVNAMCFACGLSTNRQFNHLSAHSSSSTQSDMVSAEDSLKPVQQRNWIIFDTEIKNDSDLSAENAAAMMPENHRNVIISRLPETILTTSNANAYSKNHLNFQSQNQQNLNHIPISYYSYNHSANGNYFAPTATDIKLIEPYIVTISKMRASPNIKTHGIFTQHSARNAASDVQTTLSNAARFPKDIMRNIVPYKENIDKSSEPYNENPLHHVGDDTTTADALGIKKEETEEADRLNNIFLPMRYTLDNVIYFCDLAKRFISHSDDDEDNCNDDCNDAGNADDEEKFDVLNNDLNIEKVLSENTQKSDGIQGHRQVSSRRIPQLSLFTTMPVARSMPKTPRDTESLTLAGTGRKIKKWKKKFSKFILPLLLAYKLKFLALIPVLIGGLILLVGTTGLAGFFFALFTAVMSLKSTASSKSIIVKRI